MQVERLVAERRDQLASGRPILREPDPRDGSGDAELVDREVQTRALNLFFGEVEALNGV
jgi:hypothetical protein